MTNILPRHENEHQWSVNNILYCKLGNQCIECTIEFTTKLWTVVTGKNTSYETKNTHSKMIDIALCKTCTMSLLDVQHVILIINYYQTATTRA
jgi:hypothetical protein